MENREKVTRLKNIFWRFKRIVILKNDSQFKKYLKNYNRHFQTIQKKFIDFYPLIKLLTSEKPYESNFTNLALIYHKPEAKTWRYPTAFLRKNQFRNFLSKNRFSVIWWWYKREFAYFCIKIDIRVACPKKISVQFTKKYRDLEKDKQRGMCRGSCRKQQRFERLDFVNSFRLAI